MFNLGSNHGYSVNEVIQTAAQVTDQTVPLTYAPRRPGDPAILVADASLAKKVLGWQPQYTDLTQIIAHAWAWEQAGR